MFNFLSLAILGLGLALLLAAVVGTFNHGYDYTRRLIGASGQEASIGFSDVNNLRGNIISVQNDKSHNPQWMLSGKWRINDINENQTNNSSRLELSANITMVATNGTQEHKHRVVNFTLSNLTFSNRSAILNGTGSIMTLENDEIGLPPSINNISITTKIENLRTISILPDQKITNHHFGDSPIFGSVVRRSSD